MFICDGKKTELTYLVNLNRLLLTTHLNDTMNWLGTSARFSNSIRKKNSQLMKKSNLLFSNIPIRLFIFKEYF